MCSVVGRVAHVVDEVRGARGCAVRGEGGDRLEPAERISDIGGEDDAGEEEQVLRPLSRPHGDERRDKRTAARGQINDGCGLKGGHSLRSYDDSAPVSDTVSASTLVRVESAPVLYLRP